MKAEERVRVRPCAFDDYEEPDSFYVEAYTAKGFRQCTPDVPDDAVAECHRDTIRDAIADAVKEERERCVRRVDEATRPFLEPGARDYEFVNSCINAACAAIREGAKDGS